MSNWTVICPGLTLGTHDELAPGPCVAVNSSLITAQRKGWKVDYLCIHDGLTAITPFPEDIPTVWTQERYLKNFPDAEVYSNHSGHFENEHLGMWGIKFFKRTAFIAVAIAITRGAKVVSIYGMDMDGVGYSDGEDKNNRKVHQWNKRWEPESKCMLAAFENWERRGIVINRVPGK